MASSAPYTGTRVPVRLLEYRYMCTATHVHGTTLRQNSQTMHPPVRVHVYTCCTRVLEPIHVVEFVQAGNGEIPDLLGTPCTHFFRLPHVDYQYLATYRVFEKIKKNKKSIHVGRVCTQIRTRFARWHGIQKKRKE